MTYQLVSSPWATNRDPVSVHLFPSSSPLKQSDGVLETAYSTGIGTAWPQRGRHDRIDLGRDDRSLRPSVSAPSSCQRGRLELPTAGVGRRAATDKEATPAVTDGRPTPPNSTGKLIKYFARPDRRETRPLEKGSASLRRVPSAMRKLPDATEQASISASGSTGSRIDGGNPPGGFAPAGRQDKPAQAGGDDPSFSSSPRRRRVIIVAPTPTKHVAPNNTIDEGSGTLACTLTIQWPSPLPTPKVPFRAGLK